MAQSSGEHHHVFARSVNGGIFAMAGASKAHNQIAFNIAGELHR
jgi:hypothetical protein